jgi:hypothetical protein
LEEELNEVGNRAERYEEEIAEERQGEDMELMASQVSHVLFLDSLVNTYKMVTNTRRTSSVTVLMGVAIP